MSVRFSTFADAVRSSKAISRPTVDILLEKVKPAFESSVDLANRRKVQSAVFLNAILASDFSRSMDSWLVDLVNKGVPSIYDRSMDATYNATHIGGGQLHKLFDGSHTLRGAAEKVHNASPDDTLLQEVLGYASALGKDLSTHVGLPLFGMSKSSYDQVSDFLSDWFHIPKPWFQDLMHVNGVELIGASIGTVAVAFNWNKKDVEEFSRLAGSLGLSSVASANPALAVVALVTVAKSFSDAKHKSNYSEFIVGLAKGGIGTGAFLATAAVLPGPVLVGLVTGTCVGVIAQRGTDNLSLSQISRFVEKSIKREVGEAERLRQA